MWGWMVGWVTKRSINFLCRPVGWQCKSCSFHYYFNDQLLQRVSDFLIDASVPVFRSWSICLTSGVLLVVITYSFFQGENFVSMLCLNISAIDFIGCILLLVNIQWGWCTFIQGLEHLFKPLYFSHSWGAHPLYCSGFT